MPEQLLTLEQVAEYLNVDKFTVYRLLADKELPAFKVGNQWRFKRKMIENWLLKNSNLKRKDTQSIRRLSFISPFTSFPKPRSF